MRASGENILALPKMRRQQEIKYIRVWILNIDSIPIMMMVSFLILASKDGLLTTYYYYYLPTNYHEIIYLIKSNPKEVSRDADADIW